MTWLADAILAVMIAAATMDAKARRANVSLMAGPARRFFVSYSAPLPAVWLLLYGASFISSGSFSIRVVPIMGICFMLLGLGACFVPLSIGNILMGAGFGILPIGFGFMIARSYGG